MLEFIYRKCSRMPPWEAFNFAFDCAGLRGFELNRSDERNAKIFFCPCCDDELPTDSDDMFSGVASNVHRNDHYRVLGDVPCWFIVTVSRLRRAFAYKSAFKTALMLQDPNFRRCICAFCIQV